MILCCSETCLYLSSSWVGQVLSHNLNVTFVTCLDLFLHCFCQNRAPDQKHFDQFSSFGGRSWCFLFQVCCAAVWRLAQHRGRFFFFKNETLQPSVLSERWGFRCFQWSLGLYVWERQSFFKLEQSVQSVVASLFHGFVLLNVSVVRCYDCWRRTSLEIHNHLMDHMNFWEGHLEIILNDLKLLWETLFPIAFVGLRLCEGSNYPWHLLNQNHRNSQDSWKLKRTLSVWAGKRWLRWDSAYIVCYTVYISWEIFAVFIYIDLNQGSQTWSLWAP